MGRRSSFEVTMNGKLAYSKLKRGRFPDMEQVVAMVKEVSLGGEIVEEKKQKRCTLQ